MSEWLGFCGLKVETLGFEICEDDGILARAKATAVKGLKAGFAGAALSCAWGVGEGLPNDFDKNGIV